MYRGHLNGPEAFVFATRTGRPLRHRDAKVTWVFYIREITDARRRHMLRSRTTAEHAGALPEDETVAARAQNEQTSAFISDPRRWER